MSKSKAKNATASPSLAEELRAARSKGVPLIAVETRDPATAVNAAALAIGKDDLLATWDCVRAFVPHKPSYAKRIPEANADYFAAAMTAAAAFEPDACVCVLNAHRFLDDAAAVQAVWLLRDSNKAKGRTLVLLVAPGFRLPQELRDDVLLLREELPDADELGGIVNRLHEDAGIAPATNGTLESAVHALRGLTAFGAEQSAALALRKSGLNIDAAWERKRRLIEQARRGAPSEATGKGFAGIGGCEAIKGFCRGILDGKQKPAAVVFVDEIEKALSGAAGGNDQSGVSQDQLGALLTWMQDKGAAGMILLGPAGSGKSAIAKAVGEEGKIPTIALDLGAAKGSLVGQSEQQLRAALDVIDSVSDGRSLWIATCNSIADLPPELRRRFKLGTYFFDLPDAAERAAIWALFRAKYGVAAADPAPADEGWTGAEIASCCEIAWRLGVPLAEAAEYIVPVSRSAPERLAALRKQAAGRFLSASKPGTYSLPDQHEPAAPTGPARRLVLADN